MSQKKNGNYPAPCTIHVELSNSVQASYSALVGLDQSSLSEQEHRPAQQFVLTSNWIIVVCTEMTVPVNLFSAI